MYKRWHDITTVEIPWNPQNNVMICEQWVYRVYISQLDTVFIHSYNDVCWVINLSYFNDVSNGQFESGFNCFSWKKICWNFCTQI